MPSTASRLRLASARSSAETEEPCPQKTGRRVGYYADKLSFPLNAYNAYKRERRRERRRDGKTATPAVPTVAAPAAPTPLASLAAPELQRPSPLVLRTFPHSKAPERERKLISHPSSRPSTWTGSADSNPYALRSADRREQVVADGVADDDEWAPSECPDEIATGEGQGLEEHQEGHPVRATPGHDRPSDHSCPRRLRPPSARSSAEDKELLPALNRRATSRRAGIAKMSLVTMLISFFSLSPSHHNCTCTRRDRAM
jgi:hypothetical protein